MACEYCKDEPEPGMIEMPNNGPTVYCPVCNPDGEREQEWLRAELQREQQKAERREIEQRKMDDRSAMIAAGRGRQLH